MTLLFVKKRVQGSNLAENASPTFHVEEKILTGLPKKSPKLASSVCPASNVLSGAEVISQSHCPNGSANNKFSFFIFCFSNFVFVFSVSLYEE